MARFEVVETASRMPKRALAKAFRKAPSAAEATMWRLLRGSRLDGFKFRRQAPMGNYIADFVCLSRNLVVELDGPFHDAEADAVRDAWLNDEGYRVVRFTTRSVFDDRDTVLEAIKAALRQPLLTPSPLGGEGREGA